MSIENRNGFNFDDAPGGDLDLNSIFSFDESTLRPDAPANPVTPEPAQPVTPVVPDPADAEPFLTTATGTVYRTREDAIKGTEHKDALLDQTRQKLLELTGEDPLKRKEQPSNQIPNYVTDPKRYFDDLDAAMKTNDQAKVMGVQQKFVLDTISPYAPMLQDVARSNAIGAVTRDVPDFTQFLGSEEYNKTLESFPLLKNSIEIAESNPQASADLAQLYRMAHDVSSGRNLPRIVQEQQRAPAPVAARQTVSSTPIAPSPQAPPAPRTPQERWKQTIEEMDAKGIGDRRF